MQKKEVKSSLDKFHYLFGRGDGTCAFSGAPRSAIINCRLCRQSTHPLNIIRQSVLLPQNGSHPQVPSQCQDIKKITDSLLTIRYFLVEATGLEPTTSWSRTMRATNCATPRFGFFRKWSNMWSNHSFRDFLIKLYWQNCQVFQGVQRFAKSPRQSRVVRSRTQRATNCATPRLVKI